MAGLNPEAPPSSHRTEYLSDPPRRACLREGSRWSDSRLVGTRRKAELLADAATGAAGLAARPRGSGAGPGSAETGDGLCPG